MRRARIGLAGYRVGGMTEVAVNEMGLKKDVGPRIVPLDMPQLLAAPMKCPMSRRRGHGRHGRPARPLQGAGNQDGLDSIKSPRRGQVVDRDGLDALAIGCYPHLMGRVCLAASMLADEGILWLVKAT